MSEKLTRSDDEWRDHLTEEQFQVLREKGTEPAFTGPYWDAKDAGRYDCAGCGQPLFDAATKFDSGSGWPSFYQPVQPQSVDTETDQSHGMERTEVLCSRCGGHLGHRFPDGPKPTGERYCINSVSLKFKPEA